MVDVGNPASREAPSARPHWVRGLVVAVLIAVLVLAALSFYADVSALRRSMARFDWAVAGWALLLSCANFALRGVRWHYYLLRVGVRVPVGESFLVFLAGFVMTVTPGKLGEVFKSLLLKEVHGTPNAVTAPVVVAERVTDLIGLLLLVGVGGLYVERASWLAGGAALLAIGAGVLVTSRPVGEAALAVAARLPVLRRATPKIRNAYESLFVMTRLRPLLVGTALASAAWGLQVVAVQWIVAGFPGAEVPLGAAAFAYCGSLVAGVLALMPGGLGVTEAGMTGLLQLLGNDAVTQPVAAAATIVARLTTLWWAVLVGIVALWLHRALVARPRRRGPS